MRPVAWLPCRGGVSVTEKLRPIAAALLSCWDRLRAAVDGWDLLIAASWLMLFLGLAYTWHIGIACIVMGTLGLVGGIAGARGQEIAALVAARRQVQRGGS